MWRVAIEAPDIPRPGSSVNEIKHVQFWGLFTNKALQNLWNSISFFALFLAVSKLHLWITPDLTCLISWTLDPGLWMSEASIATHQTFAEFFKWIFSDGAPVPCFFSKSKDFSAYNHLLLRSLDLETHSSWSSDAFWSFCHVADLRKPL